MEIKLFMYKFLQTLDKLHSRGIIHGDIKLENVLVTESGRVEMTDLNVGMKVGPGKGLYG